MAIVFSFSDAKGEDSKERFVNADCGCQFKVKGAYIGIKISAMQQPHMLILQVAKSHHLDGIIYAKVRKNS